MLELFLKLNFNLQILLVYLITVNVITFFFFGWDKLRSQIRGSQRVSEKMLWLLTLFGGSAGAWSGMYFFRHKTKKISFQLVVWLIFLIQAILVSWLLFIKPQS